ncbi:TIGR04282 family arsenosugar biosynthesis glycosyltransferase [Agromyces marinus]|uniref:Glycosyl transferase n=1 Tax=Agromyces marinus TaxID=1389020 RepID=A0ABM8H187_9MICO|nr:DUF2064 domain-containing protein [Agromyces marinus]UIP57359.1 hypothetical protein DSM26151_02140 [Agromyces marinus]BDZ54534.1 glycosyl transferase [Agromyces marinus]
MSAVAIIAKQCRPGRVKTRLSPPFTPEQAAGLAEAALVDTLDTVAALPVERRILYFAGDAPPRAASGFELMAQPGGGLDERLAHLFDVIEEPLLLLGMDTPQVRGDDVAAVFEGFGAAVGIGPASASLGHDAWLGPAADGGFWALAMGEPDGSLIRGVPMSRADTGRLQLARLEASGRAVGLLGELADVDTAATAASVALAAPDSRFARLHAEFTAGVQV